MAEGRRVPEGQRRSGEKLLPSERALPVGGGAGVRSRQCARGGGGGVTRVLLVPDLPLERWPAMDKYAHRLHDWLESSGPGVEVRLAAHIGDPTPGARKGRRPGAPPQGGAPEVEPARTGPPRPALW